MIKYPRLINEGDLPLGEPVYCSMVDYEKILLKFNLRGKVTRIHVTKKELKTLQKEIQSYLKDKSRLAPSLRDSNDLLKVLKQVHAFLWAPSDSRISDLEMADLVQAAIQQAEGRS